MSDAPACGCTGTLIRERNHYRAKYRAIRDNVRGMQKAMRINSLMAENAVLRKAPVTPGLGAIEDMVRRVVREIDSDWAESARWKQRMEQAEQQCARLAAVIDDYAGQILKLRAENEALRKERDELREMVEPCIAPECPREAVYCVEHAGGKEIEALRELLRRQDEAVTRGAIERDQLTTERNQLYRDINAADDRVGRAEDSEARLAEALEDARNTFQHYATLHEQKGRDLNAAGSGDWHQQESAQCFAKARNNRAHADMCSAALAQRVKGETRETEASICPACDVGLLDGHMCVPIRADPSMPRDRVRIEGERETVEITNLAPEPPPAAGKMPLVRPVGMLRLHAPSMTCQRCSVCCLVCLSHPCSCPVYE